MPPPSDGGSVASTCSAAWGQVTRLYPDATQLRSCDGVTGANYIVPSLMNLDGVTIDNNGRTMTPCVEARCDSTYVYIATNALPHYDFVQTTPNALNEVTYIYRVPMTAHVVGASGSATNAADINGCVAAYNAVTQGTGATNSEPSGFCGNDGYYYDILADDVYDYHRRIPCLNTAAMLINGVPIFGPNEGPTPDPWGNPAYNWPNLAGETSLGGAQLDLCGGHTANSMHYHAVNEACFELDVDGHPANSYVAATESWDFGSLLTADCTSESPIVGWSIDGYPIRGPCVCLRRNADGSCAEVKRARSGWVYGGLGAWGGPSTTLSAEGMACGSTSDCCQGSGSCHFKCSWSVFPDENAPGGTVADKRCVLVDYAWCTSQFVDRSGYDPAESNFVYMDRCNGYEGPDGYSYHATGSFPFLLGCYHGVPSDSLAGATLGGGMPPTMDGGMPPPPMDGGMPPPPMDGGMPPPPMDGGMPPMCMPGQTDHCCGDNFCGGPENHQNCPADCH